MKYIASFKGRDLGAIGAFYHISTIVEAQSESDARLALYERYEHIAYLKLAPVETTNKGDKR